MNYIQCSSASLALWRVIVDDALNVGDTGELQATYRLRAEALQRDLTSWYSMRRRDGFEVSEINEFILKRIGHVDHPSWGGKAAPSGDLLRFCVNLVERCQAAVKNGEAFVGAGRALLNYLDITLSASCRLSHRQATPKPATTTHRRLRQIS